MTKDYFLHYLQGKLAIIIPVKKIWIGKPGYFFTFFLNVLVRGMQLTIGWVYMGIVSNRFQYFLRKIYGYSMGRKGVLNLAFLLTDCRVFYLKIE